MSKGKTPLVFCVLKIFSRFGPNSSLNGRQQCMNSPNVLYFIDFKDFYARKKKIPRLHHYCFTFIIIKHRKWNFHLSSDQLSGALWCFPALAFSVTFLLKYLSVCTCSQVAAAAVNVTLTPLHIYKCVTCSHGSLGGPPCWFLLLCSLLNRPCTVQIKEEHQQPVSTLRNSTWRLKIPAFIAGNSR